MWILTTKQAFEEQRGLIETNTCLEFIGTCLKWDQLDCAVYGFSVPESGATGFYLSAMSSRFVSGPFFNFNDGIKILIEKYPKKKREDNQLCYNATDADHDCCGKSAKYNFGKKWFCPDCAVEYLLGKNRRLKGKLGVLKSKIDGAVNAIVDDVNKD